MFPVGTKCRLKCRKGFRLHEKSGPGRTKCQWNGEWSEVGMCVEEKCEPVTPIQNGLVQPPDCSVVSQPVGAKCSFTCNAGFRLSGKKTTTCSRRAKTWKHPVPECVSEFPRPFIMCPGDITKPLSGKATSVYVMIPQPKTNVDWFR